MEKSKLEITLHSGKGLRDVKHFGVMNPYAEIWISSTEWKQKTNTAHKGASDPVWECSMDFNNVPKNKDYVLIIKIKHDGTVFDRKIGEVKVSFADLLAGDSSGNKVSYPVKIPSGKEKGEIILSHKFSDGNGSTITSNSNNGVDARGNKGPKAKTFAKKAATLASAVATEFAIQIVVSEVRDN